MNRRVSDIQVTNVTNLNKELGTKNLAQDQFVLATNSADIVERYILMSTVLFVWKDIEGVEF